MFFTDLHRLFAQTLEPHEVGGVEDGDEDEPEDSAAEVDPGIPLNSGGRREFVDGGVGGGSIRSSVREEGGEEGLDSRVVHVGEVVVSGRHLEQVSFEMNIF